MWETDRCRQTFSGGSLGGFLGNEEVLIPSPNTTNGTAIYATPLPPKPPLAVSRQSYGSPMECPGREWPDPLVADARRPSPPCVLGPPCTEPRASAEGQQVSGSPVMAHLSLSMVWHTGGSCCWGGSNCSSLGLLACLRFDGTGVGGQGG